MRTEVAPVDGLGMDCRKARRREGFWLTHYALSRLERSVGQESRGLVAGPPPPGVNVLAPDVDAREGLNAPWQPPHHVRDPGRLRHGLQGRRPLSQCR
jgi:hypothetical protein